MRLKWALAVLPLCVSPAIVNAAPSGWDSAPVSSDPVHLPEPSPRLLVGSPSTQPFPFILTDLRDLHPVGRPPDAVIVPDPLRVTSRQLAAPSPGMQADPSSPTSGETIEESMVRLTGDIKPLSDPPRALDGKA